MGARLTGLLTLATLAGLIVTLGTVVTPRQGVPYPERPKASVASRPEPRIAIARAVTYQQELTLADVEAALPKGFAMPAHKLANAAMLAALNNR